MGGLNAILHRAGDLVSYPVKISKDLVTHPKKGWNELTHLYSHNEHEDQHMLNGIGIHGWVGKHPQETAAAVVATIFGGWAAWGAYGAGAAAGATGSAAGAAGTTGGAIGGSTAASSAGSTASLFGSSSALTYTPTASSAYIGSGVGAGGESTASLGISGSGVTAFPELTAPSYTGVLGSGSGWMGSEAAPISSNPAMSWQDYAKQFQQNGNQQGQQQNKQHWLNDGEIKYNNVEAPKFNTQYSPNTPNSVQDIIQSNNSPTTFNFGSNY